MKTLFSFVLIAASVALFVMFTNTHYQQIKALRAQAAEYDSALTQSKILLAQRDSLKKKYDEIPQENLDKLKKLAPDSVDNVRLVIDINGIAARRGMTIRNIKIQNGNAGKSGNIGPDNNPYGSMLLSFSVTAPYDSFKGFLQDLERSLRIVDITSLSFNANDKGDVYDYGVTLRTYWLRQ
jgi:Tfp pilus assembly protein PilO